MIPIFQLIIVDLSPSICNVNIARQVVMAIIAASLLLGELRGGRCHRYGDKEVWELP